MSFIQMAAIAVLAIAPVDGAVVRSFDPPACDRCSGHRGVTIASQAGASIRSPLAGEVTFAGAIGGQLYVVVAVAPQVRVTVGHMASVSSGITPGVHVRQGTELARADSTTYLSVRHGAGHRDPLRSLGLGRARLAGNGGVSDANVGRNGPAR